MKRLSLIALVIVLLLAACATEEKVVKKEVEEVVVSKYGDEITSFSNDDVMLNVFKKGSDISVVVKNISTKPVYLPVVAPLWKVGKQDIFFNNHYEVSKSKKTVTLEKLSSGVEKVVTYNKPLSDWVSRFLAEYAYSTDELTPSVVTKNGTTTVTLEKYWNTGFKAFAINADL